MKRRAYSSGDDDVTAEVGPSPAKLAGDLDLEALLRSEGLVEPESGVHTSGSHTTTFGEPSTALDSIGEARSVLPEKDQVASQKPQLTLSPAPPKSKSSKLKGAVKQGSDVATTTKKSKRLTSSSHDEGDDDDCDMDLPDLPDLVTAEHGNTRASPTSTSNIESCLPGDKVETAADSGSDAECAAGLSKADQRRRRGEIEKKRRDRINNCLEELKKLVPEASRKGNTKLEKAEILSMTVEFLKTLISGSVDAQEVAAQEFYASGHRDCTMDAIRYLSQNEHFSNKQQSAFQQHLNGCMQHGSGRHSKKKQTPSVDVAAALPKPVEQVKLGIYPPALVEGLFSRDSRPSMELPISTQTPPSHYSLSPLASPRTTTHTPHSPFPPSLSSRQTTPHSPFPGQPSQQQQQQLSYLPTNLLSPAKSDPPQNSRPQHLTHSYNNSGGGNEKAQVQSPYHSGCHSNNPAAKGMLSPLYRGEMFPPQADLTSSQLSSPTSPFLMPELTHSSHYGNRAMVIPRGDFQSPSYAPPGQPNRFQMPSRQGQHRLQHSLAQPHTPQQHQHQQQHQGHPHHQQQQLLRSSLAESLAPHQLAPMKEDHASPMEQQSASAGDFLQFTEGRWPQPN